MDLNRLLVFTSKNTNAREEVLETVCSDLPLPTKARQSTNEQTITCRPQIERAVVRRHQNALQILDPYQVEVPEDK